LAYERNQQDFVGCAPLPLDLSQEHREKGMLMRTLTLEQLMDESIRASNRTNHALGRLEQLMEESVRASDRTNHAVRAIIRPLFIQLLTGLVMLALYLLFVVAQSNVVLIFIGLVAAAGMIVSISVLASELRSSKIP
jgi:hypothetical protein